MAAAYAPAPHGIDPLSLMLGASGVVLVVLLILVSASCLVWLIWFLKSTQLRRMRSAHRAFETAAAALDRAEDLIQLAQQHKGSPGASVVLELAKRQGQRKNSSELLMAVAKRAIASEQQRAMALMPTLSSIASAAPFVDLFGIM